MDFAGLGTLINSLFYWHSPFRYLRYSRKRILHEREVLSELLNAVQVSMSTATAAVSHDANVVKEAPPSLPYTVSDKDLWEKERTDRDVQSVI